MLKDAPADHPQLARIRGRVAVMRSDYKAAIRYFQDALTEEPYDRVSFTELGNRSRSRETRPLRSCYLDRASASTPSTT